MGRARHGGRVNYDVSGGRCVERFRNHVKPHGAVMRIFGRSTLLVLGLYERRADDGDDGDR